MGLTRSDTIRRDEALQALVDEYNRKRTGDGLRLAWIEKAINSVPEAEPEIIRCKDCKHYLNSNEKCALIDTRLNFYATDKRWNGDSFCSWAERRTDDR